MTFNIVGYQCIKTLIIWFCMTGYTYSALKAPIRKGLMCYVCSPPQNPDITFEQEFNIFSNDEINSIPTCGSIEAKNFKLKCPEIYKGCITKYYDGEQNILKSCNEYSITDCKIANLVKYCFCAGNLCNDAKSQQKITEIITDDEDLAQSTEDGSGSYGWEEYGKNIPRKQSNTTTVITYNKLNNTSKENENRTFTKALGVKLFPFRIIHEISLIFLIYKVV